MSTLLEYKVDITLVDAHGWTAAKLAEACGHDSLTQLLHVAAATSSHERKAHDNVCSEDSAGPQQPRLSFTGDDNGRNYSAALSARQSRKAFDSLPQARYPSSSTGERSTMAKEASKSTMKISLPMLRPQSQSQDAARGACLGHQGRQPSSRRQIDDAEQENTAPPFGEEPVVRSVAGSSHCSVLVPCNDLEVEKRREERTSLRSWLSNLVESPRMDTRFSRSSSHTCTHRSTHCSTTHGGQPH